jgi:hypothetical protein
VAPVEPPGRWREDLEAGARPGLTTANLFWWYNMGASHDIGDAAADRKLTGASCRIATRSPRCR